MPKFSPHITFPLQKFIEHLQQLNFPIGVDDYEALLRLLESGRGWESEEGLYQLCKLILHKPSSDEKLFRDSFKWYMKTQKRENESRFLHYFRLKKISQQDSSIPTRENIREANENGPANTTSPADKSMPPSVLPKEKKRKEEGETVDFEEEVSIGLGMLEEGKQGQGFSMGGNNISSYSTDNQQDINNAPLQLNATYLPISPRQIQVGWQFFRQQLFRQGHQQVDIQGSVEAYAKHGFFKEVIYLPKVENHSKVMLWIDHSDSMLAFDDLTQVLKDTAIAAIGSHGGKKGEKAIQDYYFKNLPTQFLGKEEEDFDWEKHFTHQNIFLDRPHRHSLKVGRLLQLAQRGKYGIVIVSDAGAAKRRYDKGRITATFALIQWLKRKQIPAIWLNPMPQARWKGTSAEVIAQEIPMYDIANGLQQAIKTLKQQSP